MQILSRQKQLNKLTLEQRKQFFENLQSLNSTSHQLQYKVQLEHETRRTNVQHQIELINVLTKHAVKYAIPLAREHPRNKLIAVRKKYSRSRSNTLLSTGTISLAFAKKATVQKKASHLYSINLTTSEPTFYYLLVNGRYQKYRCGPDNMIFLHALVLSNRSGTVRHTQKQMSGSHYLCGNGSRYDWMAQEYSSNLASRSRSFNSPFTSELNGQKVLMLDVSDSDSIPKLKHFLHFIHGENVDRDRSIDFEQVPKWRSNIGMILSGVSERPGLITRSVAKKISKDVLAAKHESIKGVSKAKLELIKKLGKLCKFKTTGNLDKDIYSFFPSISFGIFHGCESVQDMLIARKNEQMQIGLDTKYISAKYLDLSHMHELAYRAFKTHSFDDLSSKQKQVLNLRIQESKNRIEKAEDPYWKNIRQSLRTSLRSQSKEFLQHDLSQVLKYLTKNSTLVEKTQIALLTDFLRARDKSILICPHVIYFALNFLKFTEQKALDSTTKFFAVVLRSDAYYCKICGERISWHIDLRRSFGADDRYFVQKMSRLDILIFRYLLLILHKFFEATKVISHFALTTYVTNSISAILEKILFNIDKNESTAVIKKIYRKNSMTLIYTMAALLYYVIESGGDELQPKNKTELIKPGMTHREKMSAIFMLLRSATKFIGQMSKENKNIQKYHDRDLNKLLQVAYFHVQKNNRADISLRRNSKTLSEIEHEISTGCIFKFAYRLLCAVRCAEKSKGKKRMKSRCKIDFSDVEPLTNKDITRIMGRSLEKICSDTKKESKSVLATIRVPSNDFGFRWLRLMIDAFQCMVILAVNSEKATTSEKRLKSVLPFEKMRVLEMLKEKHLRFLTCRPVWGVERDGFDIVAAIKAIQKKKLTSKVNWYQWMDPVVERLKIKTMHRLRLFCPDGHSHNWNLVQIKYKTGKTTLTEQQMLADRRIGTIIDHKCLWCGNLLSNVLMDKFPRSPKHEHQILLMKDKLAFYEFLKTRCVKATSSKHVFAGGRSCINCGFRLAYLDRNDKQMYLRNSYYKKFSKTQKKIFSQRQLTNSTYEEPVRFLDDTEFLYAKFRKDAGELNIPRKLRVPFNKTILSTTATACGCNSAVISNIGTHFKIIYKPKIFKISNRIPMITSAEMRRQNATLLNYISIIMSFYIGCMNFDNYFVRSNWLQVCFAEDLLTQMAIDVIAYLMGVRKHRKTILLTNLFHKCQLYIQLSETRPMLDKRSLLTRLTELLQMFLCHCISIIPDTVRTLHKSGDTFIRKQQKQTLLTLKNLPKLLLKQIHDMEFYSFKPVPIGHVRDTENRETVADISDDYEVNDLPVFGDASIKVESIKDKKKKQLLSTLTQINVLNASIVQKDSNKLIANKDSSQKSKTLLNKQLLLTQERDKDNIENQVETMNKTGWVRENQRAFKNLDLDLDDVDAIDIGNDHQRSMDEDSKFDDILLKPKYS